MTETTVKAPSWRLLLLETRMFPELARAWLSPGALRDLPRGAGQAVMVVPGFGASDFHTRLLRRGLKQLGYDVHGWGLGLNTGMNSQVRKALAARVTELQAQSGRKVSLVGWSLGGVFVRELARQLPEKIAQIFTLGSPINITPAANNMLPLFKLMNRGKPVKLDMEGFLRRAEPPPVRCTALHSKSDGIVAWQTACEPEAANTENVEVSGSHFGMVCNAQVVREIALRLSEAN